MTPLEYRTALATLGLSQQAAGRWLGVSPKTAQNYATKGPSGPAAKAVNQAIIIKQAFADLEGEEVLAAVSNACFALDLALNEIDRHRK